MGAQAWSELSSASVIFQLVDTMSAPDQQKMGNAQDDDAANVPAQPARLGEKSSDYTGCWYACAGICMHRLCPCGEGCIYDCCCCCGMPCCMCYFKDDGVFKEAIVDRGGKKILHMVDEKTINLKQSTNAKDHAWGQAGAQA